MFCKQCGIDMDAADIPRSRVLHDSYGRAFCSVYCLMLAEYGMDSESMDCFAVNKNWRVYGNSSRSNQRQPEDS